MRVVFIRKKLKQINKKRMWDAREIIWKDHGACFVNTLIVTLSKAIDKNGEVVISISTKS